ncbi:MAG: hypothetical protein Q8L34_00980 [Candidatus Woesearchaeota archaeon]|nr:hypothetical protein [Candidatus Woesearchaeota archaeon]
MEEDSGRKEYWDLMRIAERERNSRYAEEERARQNSKARSFTSLLGGIALGSLLTAYCWIPSNMSVRDIDGDERADVVVEQMNGARRTYMQQQDGSYKLDTKYLDDLLTILPW